MEKLLALQDINDTIKAGDRFDAPDLIYVALGLAARAVPEPDTVPDVSDEAEPLPSRRRGRGRRSA